MKPNVLRAPLVKAAIVIIIFSLLVYFTSSTPDGSVWSSIGTIILTAFTTIQWVVALAAGLVLSLAVLIGIFFGAVAMVNPSAASRMYEGLRQTLLYWFAPVINFFKSDREEKLATALDSFGHDLKVEIREEIRTIQAALSKNQAELEGKVSSLVSQLTTLEQTVATLPNSEQVEAVAEEVKTATEAAAAVQASVDSLKGTVDQGSKQLQEISAETLLGDLPARLETLEQQEIPEPAPAIDLSPLESTISTLQAELEAVRNKAEEALQLAAARPEPVAAPESKKTAQKKEAAEEKKTGEQQGDDEEEHRIFSYFTDPDDKKKVADLVASTLKKDMSYKQVMDLVAKELGREKGAIITSHPSLSKDYIRQCRRQNG